MTTPNDPSLTSFATSAGRCHLGPALACSLALLLPAASAGAFEPVNYKGANATIELTRLGSYRGGIFADESVEVAPAHDASKQRLYHIDAVRDEIVVLDIDDPRFPHKEETIDLGRIGEGAVALAFRSGVLAIAFRGPNTSSAGTVAFINRDGRPEAPPVRVGAQPTMLVFSPDGKKLLVPGRGEASDDYGTDPEGTLSVIDWCRSFPCSRPDIKVIDFRAFNARRQELVARGVRFLGPGADVADDLEPESVTVSPDSRTAWITLQRNNALAVVDLVRNEVRDILPLGSKNHLLKGRGLDASDEDGRIRIARWPLRSWYQPDYIAAFPANGRTFLVTANEGDPRDFSGFQEVARVADLPLDAVTFPNRMTLQQPTNLGRLRVSRVEGQNAHGQYERLYAFGGRSLAVWTAGGKLVAETGNAFERVTAAAVPRFFNVPDDSNAFDETSDQRGPEPEPLAVGAVDGRQYVFIGLERISGMMVYDVTNPYRPHFEQYINNRNFAVDPAAVCEKGKRESPACAAVGDLSVEGVLFIPASRSPTGVPLLVVSHETSDSITLYRVDRVP